MCKQQWAWDRRAGVGVRSTALPPNVLAACGAGAGLEAPLSQGSESRQRLEGKGKWAAAVGRWAALPREDWRKETSSEMSLR